MISYRSPKVSAYYYFIFPPTPNRTALGPFVDLPAADIDSVNVRDPNDFLKESAGVYGENNVSHRQLNASLSWSPLPSIVKMVGSEDIPIKGRYANGSFYRSGTSINTGALLREGYEHDPESDTNFLVTGPRSFELRKFKATHSLFSSVSTLASVTIDRFTYGPGNLEYSDATHHRIELFFDSLKFSTVDIPGVEPSFIGSTGWRERVIRGDYPPSHKREETSSFSERKYWYASPVKPDSDVGGALSAVRSLIDLPLPEVDVIPFHDLQKKAVEALDDNNVNMLAFIKDIRKPWELIPKLKNLSSLKTHAGNYLGYEYGILPTVSDLQSIVEAINRHAAPYYDSNDFRVLTSSASSEASSSVGTVRVIERCKIAISRGDDRLFGLSDSLHNLGGFPTLENLWDLVPYSFVVDWFINVGNMLEQVDFSGRVARLGVKYTTRSSKTIINYELPIYMVEQGITGSISVIHYTRSVSEGTPPTPLNFEVSNELPNHWLEAGALILTRTK